MRYSFLILFPLYLASCTGTMEGDNSNPNEFGKLIFNAIKNDRPDVYREYIFTMSEIEPLIEEYTSGPGVTPEWAQEMRQKQTVRYATTLEQLNESYDAIQEKAQERGIDDWDKFEFQRVTYNLVEMNSILRALDTTVEFKSDDFYGTINIGNIYHTDRGWVMVHVPKMGKVMPNMFGKLSQ